MSTVASLPRSKRNLILIILSWIFLWVIPWGDIPTIQDNLYLAFITDMTRLGIALVLFIVPGILLYILLRGNSDPFPYLSGIIPIGFAFSVFLIAVIGLAGRIAGVSFSLVRNSFGFVGLAALWWVILRRSDLIPTGKQLQDSVKTLVKTPPLLVALVFVIVMSMHENLFFIDDTTYAAYLTHWQHSERLGFQNIIHPANVLEHVRFWLAMLPMGQALLADLSGVPGLLLMGNYLELFLAPMAVITSYWFARILGLTSRAASFSVLLQVALYTWMIGAQWPVGMWFYESLAEDKVAVAFFLAPVFFAMVVQFVEQTTWRNRFLTILSGLGIMLTHPVMFFFTCAIGALIVLCAWISRRASLRHVTEIFLICVVMMIPYAVIRLSDSTGEVTGAFSGEQASTTFQIDRYTNIIGDVFYGLNPQVLMFLDVTAGSESHATFQLFRAAPLILLALGGVIALRRVHQGPLYWYVFSSSLLVFLATLPYTGWILGYFVSARMISRAAWFSPLGLGGILVFQSIMDWFKRISAAGKRQITLDERRRVFWGVIVVLLFVSPFLVISVLQRIPLYFERLDHNKQLAAIGHFIDNNTFSPTTVIALNYRDVQLLPAVSAHANLISFREELAYNGHNNFLPLDEIYTRIDDSNTIRSLELSNEKCPLLEKYALRFIVSGIDDLERFEQTLAACHVEVERMYQGSDLVLVEIK
jgi:hypothetical protein